MISRASWFSTYGLYVSIEHGGQIQTRYAHMSRLNVAEGQRVHKGDVIGFVGTTGRSTGPHLHYEVRVDGAAVNPVPYMNGDQQMAPKPIRRWVPRWQLIAPSRVSADQASAVLQNRPYHHDRPGGSVQFSLDRPPPARDRPVQLPAIPDRVISGRGWSARFCFQPGATEHAQAASRRQIDDPRRLEASELAADRLNGEAEDVAICWRENGNSSVAGVSSKRSSHPLGRAIRSNTSSRNEATFSEADLRPSSSIQRRVRSSSPSVRSSSLCSSCGCSAANLSKSVRLNTQTFASVSALISWLLVPPNGLLMKSDG